MHQLHHLPKQTVQQFWITPGEAGHAKIIESIDKRGLEGLYRPVQGIWAWQEALLHADFPLGQGLRSGLQVIHVLSARKLGQLLHHVSAQAQIASKVAA